MSLYEAIIDQLAVEKIPFQEFSHASSNTCEQSAAVRSGIDGLGSKCVVMKASKSGRFFLCVTHAGARIGKAELRSVMGEKEFRFADDPEIVAVFPDAPKGAIPPIGQPETLLALVDETIFSHDFFLFNPARHDRTIQIKTTDLKRLFEVRKNTLFFSLNPE